MFSGYSIRETVKTFAPAPNPKPASWKPSGIPIGTAVVERPLSRKALKRLAPALYAEARAKWPRRRRAPGQTYWSRILDTKYQRQLAVQEEKRARQKLASKLAASQTPSRSVLDTLFSGVRKLFTRRAA